MVWVFGSRAKKTRKPFSDLDLAIDAASPLAYSTLVNLKNDFEESDLPYKVDVVDWHLIDKGFQTRIGVYRDAT
jgi:predicted nucleotidyltransferase